MQGDKLAAKDASADALSEYTKAIELFLSVASNAKAPSSQRARCRSACESLITKAEGLKKQISTRRESLKKAHARQSLKRRTFEKPIEFPILCGDKLSTKEETILLRSSKINGGKYPPLPPGTKPVIEDNSEPFTYFPFFVLLSRGKLTSRGTLLDSYLFRNDKRKVWELG